MATKKWKDVRPGVVAGLGGSEAVVEQAHRHTQAYIDACLLAERRGAWG